MSEAQFRVFVSFLKRGADPKGRKRSRATGGPQEKRLQVAVSAPAEDMELRLTAFESDMATVKSTLEKLSAVLLSPSGFPLVQGESVVGAPLSVSACGLHGQVQDQALVYISQPVLCLPLIQMSCFRMELAVLLPWDKVSALSPVPFIRCREGLTLVRPP